ncbi:uncharacterized protein STEHIDRAFT_62354 [Stereum hirsutum FP-91666 SS1]|uniref:uncharacterized protein n=1 Tax=Stereum hirsutum (strain FP-91666) TaxID=721885 RepID=UPI0004449DB3|nr:uncharacterized protein STEHIDRAFT_62354 [Stereum hirsutum FP-91666 SS1]EIM83792.1 hypothetical protein STEHIDRAFT_62354 [Stereum hirsutum FP-91666 SS1]
METPNNARAASPLPENAATTNCSCSKTLGRNLVVCIDGTSNKLGKKNTNVIELYGLLEKDTNQVTFYNSGIGTFAKPSWKSLTHLRHAIGHKLDLAIAWDFEKIVILAYRWLSENYQPNDRIFLFGFSRGAYQVRCLSAMIKTVGLIYRGNEAQIPFAYELYAAITEDENSEANLVATRFRNEFSRAVNVHFVGAWDTVSSVGILRSKSLPRTTSGMEHVCYFRHALALDERRVKFLPEYARGGSSLPDPSHVRSDSNPPYESSPDDPPRVKEVWFAGTHTDIDLDQNEPPLQWMASEATAVGLKTVSVETRGEATVVIHESLTCPWWLLEIMPWRRLSYETSKNETMVPHLGRGRYIRAGQKIHSSVKHGSRAHKTILQMMGHSSSDTTKKHVVGATTFRVSSNYTPRASIRVEDRLDEIEGHRFLSPEEKFEPDLSDLALELVEKLSSLQQSGELESQAFRNRVRPLYYSRE